MVVGGFVMTTQANLEQQSDLLTEVILYFIVDGGGVNLPVVSFCLSISHYCPAWTVSTENTQHAPVEYQWFSLIQSKSNIIIPAVERPLVIRFGSGYQHILFEIIQI